MHAFARRLQTIERWAADENEWTNFEMICGLNGDARSLSGPPAGLMRAADDFTGPTEGNRRRQMPSPSNWANAAASLNCPRRLTGVVAWRGARARIPTDRGTRAAHLDRGSDGRDIGRRMAANVWRSVACRRR